MIMKNKLILLTVISFLMIACSNDEYADLRKMTVQDFLDNKEKMNEVNKKCNNREIKDEEICTTVKKAINNNHNAW